MFSKKLFLLFFVFCLPFISHANFFSEFTCFKDMGRYYPYLVKGELIWEKQKRFFRCLHDTLELFVEKKIFTHDDSRNYFTKKEIFKMFHIYFEYDFDLSSHLTNKVFFIKKALIGGSINKLKDKELADFYKLVYDYQEIYFILHKQIPVFQKAFSEGPGAITPKQRKKALDQIRKSFILLERAYTRENIVYQIDDLYKYGEYHKKSQFVEKSKIEFTKQNFWFLHNLLEGLFSPKKEIKKKDWLVVLSSLYKTISFFFYYKTYFVKDISSSEFVYRILEGMEIFISTLRLAESQIAKTKTGFPLKNLDEMLFVMTSFFNQGSGSSPFNGNLFAKLNKTHAISLFTRTLTCFSLENSSEKNCKSKWGSGSSSPIVTLSFADTKFEVFSDKIQKSQTSNQSAFIGMKKLKFLKQWLANYKKSFLEIHSGNVSLVAKSRQFDHWLDPFFGWGENSRIKFGTFHDSKGPEKAFQLLNYQAFLPLLFSSYLPKGFFSSEEKEKAGISFKTWKSMMEDISPALFALYGIEDYQSSWRQSLFNLFSFADTFLSSSNRDELLNAKEFIDLTVHLLEGVKNSHLAYSKVSNECENKLTPSCVAEKILSNQEILAAYPRFQKHLFDSQIDKYKERIEAVLGRKGEQIQALNLLPLFVLIQTIELNYKLIDRNQSFYLESDELLLFGKKIEAQLESQIPYLSNQNQERAYLMYSFKTGDIPFFTGDRFTPLKFTNWYLNPKSHKPFKISPSEFHFLIFDFYKLYQKP